MYGPREAWGPHPSQYGRGPMDVSRKNVLFQHRNRPSCDIPIVLFNDFISHSRNYYIRNYSLGLEKLLIYFLFSRGNGRDKCRLISEGHLQEVFHHSSEWDREGQFQPGRDLIR